MMVCDHIHQMFFEFGAPSWLSMLGRLVFPILLFIFADSFHYTHSRKKLMTRLLLMSWFMRRGNFIVGNSFDNGQVVLSNNAFSTFFVVALLDSGWDRIVAAFKENSGKKFFKGIGFILLPVIMSLPMFFLAPNLDGEADISPLLSQVIAMVMLLIPNLFTIEGGFVMVILGWVFCIFRENRILQYVALLEVSALSFHADPSGVQWMMVFSLIPIALYNGQNGKGDKYFFYIFYPAHIYFLYILASFLR